MSEAQDMELVKRMHEALEDDDISSVLQVSAPDAEWRYPAVREIAYSL